jgi:hypothetical protein
MKYLKLGRQTLSGAILFALAPAVFAEDVMINNANFDTPQVQTGAILPGAPSGWTVFNQGCQFPPTPFQNGTGAGIAHPAAGSLIPSNDGSQTGVIVFALQGSNTQLCQQVMAPLARPGTNYTFSMDFYRLPSDPPLNASMFFCETNFTVSMCPAPMSSLTKVPANGGTVTGTLFVGADAGSPSTVTFTIGVAASGSGGAVYFNHARLQAIPIVPHSSGLVGVYAHRPGVTGVLSLLCAAPPCDGTLEFLDLNGVLVSQKQVSIRQGIGSLEQPGPLDRLAPPEELVPVWFLANGSATVSFALEDTSSGRTGLFTNWADGSVSKQGTLRSGPIGLTSSDTARLKAYCDGSVRNTSCDALLTFTDAVTGTVLEQSRLTLHPGTGTYLDLSFRDSSVGLARSVVPTVTFTGGRGIAQIALFDATTGDTITQSGLVLATAESAGDNDNQREK